MVAIELEKCGKCEKVVYEAEGFPAGEIVIIHSFIAYSQETFMC